MTYFIWYEMTQPPRSTQFDDVYFSADGGPDETLHVFLNGNNLPAAWQGRPRFTIGETGFGTGLNFLLAWELFEKTTQTGAFLDFVSVEKFPMGAEEIRHGLAPWAERLEPYLSKMLEQYPIRVPGFHRMVFDNRVALTLIFDDANDALPEIDGQVDAWFLDGFTPAKNPDMWSEKVFSEIARLSHAGTSFATFTAAGFVKRGLQAAGFTVEKRKGFGRKRDMMAGHFNGLAREDKTPARDIVILGAGLAGTSCAYVLKQYGFNPVLVDPNGIASGASGNPCGIVNPRFTAFRSAESDFYTAAYAQAVRTLPHLNDIDYLRCGSLHLLTDDDKRTRLTRTKDNWGWHDDHMQLLDRESASAVAGIDIDKDALFLPDSIRLNPKKLCNAYAKDIEVVSKTLNEDEVVIHAHGASIADIFPQIPLHTVRGQISLIRELMPSIKANICYGGYISAPSDGWHVVGSTFQKWLDHTDVLDEDHAQIIGNLRANVPAIGAGDIIGGRAALRTASKDRFPVIGPAPNGRDALISTAHGSHGIVSTLAGAHLLADILRVGIKSIGKSTIASLSPLRFEKRLK